MSKSKVLVADDHHVVIEGVKSLLREHDQFEIIGTAYDGREVVEQTRLLEPDIVIMDISMPELNGVEATMEIKRLDPNIQVLIFTMYPNDGYIIELFKAGISGYVLKGSSVSELIRALEAVQAGGTYFTSLAPQVILKHLKDAEKTKKTKEDIDCLSPREREVFQLLADGDSIKSIGEKLTISPKTVETHKYNIMEK